MKSKLLAPLLFALLFSAASFGQAGSPMYYVTIGVYGVHDFAVKFTETANKNNFNAQYAINPARKLYYVYLMSTPDKAKAVEFMLKIRLDTPYKECWVFGGQLGGDGDLPQVPVVKETPVEKKPEIITPPVVREEPKPEVKKDSVIEAPVVVKEEPVVEKPVEPKPEEPKPVEVKHDGTPFLFKVVSQETGNEIVGEIHVQETSKATQFQAFRGNEIVYIKPPLNDKGTYTIVTQVPGYQQVKTTLVYRDPGVSKGDKNEYIIPLELKRAKHGDYIDFNNVKFVRNSSIMTPDSQSELDGLVLLMKDNPKYKIKIHGHSNGKQNREITTMGTSSNYFQMDPAGNKKATVSSMVLSEERAKAVKGYIASQGIDASRISTKGEGGRIPLYSTNSTLAGYNDRVEIEIKKN